MRAAFPGISAPNSILIYQETAVPRAPNNGGASGKFPGRAAFRDGPLATILLPFPSLWIGHARGDRVKRRPLLSIQGVILVSFQRR
jgi:hypothetical protein